jgi:hypothetical protein
MVCIVKQSSHRCGLVGLMTDRAGNLGQAGGFVQFWELSPGGSNLVSV